MTQVDTSVAPYFDDFSEEKNFYKVLFRPEYYVQTRELNQLQTILQKQIEKFGDNVYKNGTIISGCNFNFNSIYSYVKLPDLSIDNIPVAPSDYVGMYAVNQTGVTAYIKNYRDGYQTTDPNLKTIYIDYIKFGSNGDSVFASGDTLRISDRWNSIFSINVASGGTGYSNSDSLVVVPAVAVLVDSGPGFSVGEYVSQISVNTRAIVSSVNTTMYSDRAVVFLTPTTADLSNTASNTISWHFVNNYSIVGNTSGTTGTVIDVFGHSLVGQILTTDTGSVNNIIVTNQGKNYRLAPYVTVKPANTSAISSGLSLIARNYLHNVTVPTVANVAGVGYAMTVTSGTIYKNGYFIGTDEQTIIVEPYSPSPNNISVYFDITETTITPEIDESLYDNALGAPNYTAPGAHRLKITANLELINTSSISNSSLLVLTSFSEGLPYKQNFYTQFNSIEEEMARRTFDEAGDYVLDRFNVTTRSPLSSNSANLISLIVDPGKAYVSGYRVETQTNFQATINKGIDVSTSNASIISLDYNQYFRINEVGGVFKYNIGDTVTFYDTAKSFISNTSLSLTNNTTPVGSIVGTASLRSLVLESGVGGSNSAIYRMYLFNVTPAAGKSISQAKSISYDGGGLTGITDIITTYSPTINASVAILQGNNSALVFSPQLGHVKQVANVTYTYRSINTTATSANNGQATLSLVANPNETFPYNGNLTSSQMNDLYVIPLADNMIYSNALTGTVTVNTTSTNIVGTGTNFLSVLSTGDYLWIANSTANTVQRIVSVANDTSAVLASNAAVALTSVSAYRYFPRGVPVPFGNKSYLSANVNANGAILTLNFGNTFQTTTSSNIAIGFNATRTNVSPGTKTANRNRLVKIYTGNNAGNTIGPWALGVPDIVRLKGVYIVNSTSTTPVPNTANDITSSFFIDHGHSEDIAGVGWLYKTPSSKLSINATTYMLVEFDCMTATVSGFYSTESYTTANSTTIFTNDILNSSNLTNVATTWEIPEFLTNGGKYYDLMEYIDFRPIVTPTANIANVTLNPSDSNVFSTSADLKFPLPGSTLTADVTYYKSRVDLLNLDRFGKINIITGTPALNNPKASEAPKNTLTIEKLLIPSYPTLPQYWSSVIANSVVTKVGTVRPITKRIENSKIISVSSKAEVQDPQNRGYKMADIANLERRIKNLEYYVNLNSLETLIAQQAIPSSISQSVNRFKYGFYADDFSTLVFADIKNPEFASTIYTKRARAFPKSEKINLTHNTLLSFPEFNEATILTQNSATGNIATGNTTPCILDNSNAAYVDMEVGDFWRNQYFRTQSTQFTMSDYAGTVTLYFYHIEDLGGIYMPFNISISKTNTVIANLANISPIPNAEFQQLIDRGFMNTIYNFQPYTHQYAFRNKFYSNTYAPDGSDWGGFGKITFSHTPQTGKDYIISVGGEQWAYALTYPVNATEYVDCENQGTGGPIVLTINTAASNTVVQNDDYAQVSVPENWPSIIHLDGVRGQDRIITMNFKLFPNMHYALSLDNDDYSAFCKPFGKNLGDPLITDSNGNLSFEFFLQGISNDYFDEEFYLPTRDELIGGDLVKRMQYSEWIGKNYYKNILGKSLRNIKILSLIPKNIINSDHWTSYLYVAILQI